MATPMRVYSEIAAEYGVDPTSADAVDDFFELGVPRLSAPAQAEIFSRLLAADGEEEGKLPAKRERARDWYAEWSYEQLIQRQAHLRFDGLWRLNTSYFVACPDADTARTLDGEPVKAWFDSKCRVIASAISIVSALPEGAVRIEERTTAERVALQGSPRTARDVYVDLALTLPRSFPDFALDNPRGETVMVTARPLTPEEQAAAGYAYARLGDSPPLQYHVDAGRKLPADFRFTFTQGDIDLVPARRLPATAGRALRHAVEADEDFWVSHRHEVMGTFSTNRETVLEEHWLGADQLACFVDATVQEPLNLRSYLSLYERVDLALPLADRFVAACGAMGVSSSELLQLVELGRVRLVLPQSVDRYDLAWLSEAAELQPLLLSRRLAAATVVDARRRLPILFAPLSPFERYLLLHTLSVAAAKLPTSTHDWARKLVHALGQGWASADNAVNRTGAIATSAFGIGGLAASGFEHVTGRDLFLELTAAGSSVERAGALGAHLFPYTSETYDEAPACDVVASLYGAVSGDRVKTSSAKTVSTIGELLAVDNEAPIISFATQFTSADVTHLRALLRLVTKESVDPTALGDAIRRFNVEVRHFESESARLRGVNLIGLLRAGLVPKVTSTPLAERLPKIDAVHANLNLVMTLASAMGSGGELLRALNERPTRDAPEAVLVARTKHLMQIAA